MSVNTLVAWMKGDPEPGSLLKVRIFNLTVQV